MGGYNRRRSRYGTEYRSGRAYRSSRQNLYEGYLIARFWKFILAGFLFVAIGIPLIQNPHVRYVLTILYDISYLPSRLLEGLLKGLFT